MADKGFSHQQPRQSVSEDLRKKILEKYGYACCLCGASSDAVPLELAFLRPTILGGEVAEDNLTVLCANCHARFDSQPREVEFVDFLASLLRAHPAYHDVVQDAVFGREIRYQADILAERSDATGNERLLIECKTAPPGSENLQRRIREFRQRQEAYGDCRFVLSVPATFSERDLKALKEKKIEVWDLEYIASNFKTQIQSLPISYYKILFLTRINRKPVLAPEQKLLDRLRKTPPGLKDWNIYQSIVGDILELLFCPSLARPIAQHSDLTRANRRDFILPNYVNDGFWSFMREKYGADYIVVDAKNSAKKIGKNDVLQIANYLKPHGAGLVGVIVCRKGGDAGGCQVTLREQWLVHQKLILVLDDEDLEAMLLTKSDARRPEELIQRKIEQFRLSM